MWNTGQLRMHITAWLLVATINGHPYPGKHVSKNSFELAKSLTDDYFLNPKAVQSPTSFQGDITFSDGEIAKVLTGDKTITLWPGARIPYTLPEDIKEDDVLAVNIAGAIMELCHNTCIEWVPYKNHDLDPFHVEIQKSNQPWCEVNQIGMAGDRVRMVLGKNDCFNKGQILHEMLHIAGLYHEQSRMDRDNHVSVRFKNIEEGMQEQFHKHDSPDYGEPYDIDSILQYESFAFSRNEERTILRKDKPHQLIKPKKHLSPGDIKELNKMYNCKKIGCEELNIWPPKTIVPPMPVIEKEKCEDTLGVDCRMHVRNGFCDVKFGPGLFVEKNCCRSCRESRLEPEYYP